MSKTMKLKAGFAVLVLVAGLSSGPILAVGSEPPAPDLAPAQAMIDAGDFAGAIQALLVLLADDEANADVLNLLGYASRKSGALEDADRYYAAALSADPEHLGALEYQGELFLMTGQPERAAANLDRLTALCGTCEEQVELAAAIAGGS